MKTLIFLFTLFLMISCTKPVEDSMLISSLDQITGIWKWESTCGGFTDNCGYSSSSHYAQIEFTSGAQFIETHNDTVYFAAHYEIQKSEDNHGTLNLYKMGSDDILSKGSISILDNKLQLSFGGELYETYKKIK